MAKRKRRPVPAKDRARDRGFAVRYTPEARIEVRALAANPANALHLQKCRVAIQWFADFGTKPPQAAIDPLVANHRGIVRLKLYGSWRVAVKVLPLARVVLVVAIGLRWGEDGKTDFYGRRF